MSDSSRFPPRRPAAREPIFNVAPVIIGLAGVLLAIQALRAWLMSQNPDADLWTVYAFAFIPAREFASASDLFDVPGGDLARYWTPLTYAFLHANWAHVLVNVLWLIAFGSPLAWRFGTLRFLLFSAVGAIAGALLHFVFFAHDMTPLVGASAAISAHMGGVSRFAFEAGGPLSGGMRGASYRGPAPPLTQTLRNRRVLAFIGIWFAVNLVFGISGAAGLGVLSGAVAWDAHIGGFLAGLLLFPLFDRR
jgi:membrane associated rhomboid family serine protease